MKKRFTHLLFFLISLTAAAQNNNFNSMMAITNLGPQPVYIEIDGRRYSNCVNTFALDNIVTGNHIIKIFSRGSCETGADRPIILYNRNYYVKEGYFVDIIINRFGRVLTDEQGLNDTWNDHTMPAPSHNSSVAVSDETFGRLKETITNESFDDGRMAIAKSIAAQNYFTAEQAKQMVQLFVFEKNQIDIAEFMYPRTVDKGNYFVVYGAFTFESGKKALAEFLRNYK
jgi:nuclear transport factor 2 (NTF2) superfamily protein